MELNWNTRPSWFVWSGSQPGPWWGRHRSSRLYTMQRARTCADSTRGCKPIPLTSGQQGTLKVCKPRFTMLSNNPSGIRGYIRSLRLADPTLGFQFRNHHTSGPGGSSPMQCQPLNLCEKDVCSAVGTKSLFMAASSIWG